MNALPIIIGSGAFIAGGIAFLRWKVGGLSRLKEAILAPTVPIDPYTTDWHEDAFFTEHRRKTEKLAALALYIEDSNRLRLKRIRQKKEHRSIEKAMQAACRERLEIEEGRRVWTGSAWELA